MTRRSTMDSYEGDRTTRRPIPATLDALAAEILRHYPEGNPRGDGRRCACSGPLECVRNMRRVAGTARVNEAVSSGRLRASPGAGGGMGESLRAHRLDRARREEARKRASPGAGGADAKEERDG